MYYLIYNSYAKIKFDDASLKELLVQARDTNEKIAITGMLFYFTGQFIQLIEGDEAVVKELAKTISKDPRHEHFIILKEGPTEERYFADWSMGMKSIDPKNFEDVKSFKELKQQDGQHIGSIRYLLKLATTD